MWSCQSFGYLPKMNRLTVKWNIFFNSCENFRFYGIGTQLCVALEISFVKINNIIKHPENPLKMRVFGVFFIFA